MSQNRETKPMIESIWLRHAASLHELVCSLYVYNTASIATGFAQLALRYPTAGRIWEKMISPRSTNSALFDPKQLRNFATFFTKMSKSPPFSGASTAPWTGSINHLNHLWQAVFLGTGLDMGCRWCRKPNDENGRSFRSGTWEERARIPCVEDWRIEEITGTFDDLFKWGKTI